MEKYEITRVFPDREEIVNDLVTKEIPLTIYVNDKEIVTLLASPGELVELAAGFVYTSDFISDFNQILKITQNTQRWTVSIQLKDGEFDPNLAFRRILTSGCGHGTLIYKTADFLNRSKSISKIKVHRDQVFHLMADFQSKSTEFKKTGAVHSAALADVNRIVIVREDIGRHNTIDKVLGYSLMNNIDLTDKMILSSGRVSSEILLKIQKTQIGMIISRSAPTDQAIQHAEDCDITLIGFARGKRMNVYSGMHRIK